MPIDERIADLQAVQWEDPYIRRFVHDLPDFLDYSLRGDRYRLDRFVNGLRAVPRGIVVHWIAGNTPTIGILSVVLGRVTGNENYVKLPKGMTLPDAFPRIRTTHSREKAAQWSEFADVRVAWGGHDAVQAIANLPKKWDCQDIVFGPKLSLSLVGKECQGELTARQVAIDASLFNQAGCNSCQTVVIERNKGRPGQWFAKMLADAMGTLYTPTAAPLPTWYRVLQDRARHHVDGQVFGPPGPVWTVLYRDSSEIPTDPAMGRTLYVRTIDDLHKVRIPEGTQTVGLKSPNHKSIAEVIAPHCDRITPVGRMTEFTSPWDGVFPVERMIRWVSKV